MKHPYTKMGVAAISLAFGALTVSCIDDNYDLSDIDTTTELKVNDLTVPINFKEIYLDKIIDLDDSDPDATIKIREVDGEKYYYFSQGGEFDADPVDVAMVHAPAPDHIQSSTITISSADAVQTPAGMRKTAPEFREYAVTPYSTTFEYNVGSGNNPKVDESIKTITDVSISNAEPLRTTLTFSSQAIASIASRVELFDLVITVPEGAEATYGDIHSVNGKITIPHLTSTTGSLAISIDIKTLNFVTAEHPEGKAVVNGAFDFAEQVGVESGRFLVYPDAGYSVLDLPADIDFTTDYDMSEFSIYMFSGEFDYALDFDDVDPFEIKDLPEFLAGKETNIILAKPLLTLEVNSPVARYGLECVSGLTLTAERSNGGAPVTEILDMFTVESGKTFQRHALAPSRDALADLANADSYIFTPFPGLSNILAGEGMPDIVRVQFKSASEPKPRVIGNATNFLLGHALDKVHGKYEFSAPLALAEGSVIVYTKTVDGWSDEDVDAIAISKLRVSAKVSSTIPAAAKVYIRPIDKDGKRIPLTNAETAFATMPANASNHEISLELLGDIRNLDGIYIEAIVDDFDGSNLSPDASIKVADLRAAVTGTYTKEL